MYRKLPKVEKYIEARIAGANKQDSAIQAHYSPETAKHPSLIENTQKYALIITETLSDNSQALRQMVRYINQDVMTKAFQALPTQVKVDIAYKVAKIHDVLTPKVTVKTSTDSKGNKTTTAWGTNAPQLHEAIGNEE